MDISSLLGTMLSQDSVKQISKTTKVSSSGVQGILGSALPSLLNGALSQSSGEDTAESFAGALSQHSASDTSNIKSFIKGVDMEDGSKIVGHLLGGNSDSVMQTASNKAGVSQENTSSVLSAAAPLLMSLLGQETNAQKKANSTLGVSDIMGGLIGNTDMGALLSGLAGSKKKSKSGLLSKLFG